MKSVFELIQLHDHEQVVFCNDRVTGLKAIIAIHNTTLGPALGGTRMWPYVSEAEALWDVLNLSRDMTYKAAAAGLKLGGGKSVIIGDPQTMKTPEYFRAFGRFLETLGGRYIASEDVGTTVEDLEYAHLETKHIAGTDPHRGGRGDPSPLTALGVFHGIEACLAHRFDDATFKGRRVAVQGAGKVGSHLVHRLIEAGAEVIVTDIDELKLQALHTSYGVRVCAPSEIYDQECDVFAPCAMSGALSDETIPRLKCAIVAGGSNVQIERREHADMLHARGILYAPDYVINAGGLINVGGEHFGWDVARIVHEVENIAPRLTDILTRASRANIPPLAVADEMVREVISK